MSEINFEEDQQEVSEKSDIKQLSHYCLMLQNYEDQIKSLEKDIKTIKEQANKISSEVIPGLLSEQGLSSLKLADGSKISIQKKVRCSVRKDFDQQAYKWLRENELGDIIKNVVSVQFGKGEDNKAIEMYSLASQQGYEPEQKESVHSGTLAAILRERVEAGLDMPSEFFTKLVEDETKISRK
jgi:hypothetical protein|tara:strand:+ start:11 stop:559 length:549 start_codon:yes stop_codon:yes gene_type:complete